MRKAFKIFLIFTSSIILLAGGFALYLYANTDVIKKYFVEKLNEQIEAKISIYDIELSLFSQFPKVSLDLKKVNISDPFNEKRMLLQAQHIYIGFNLYDILSKNYTIKQITIDSGTCNIFCSKEGKYNFKIFKKDSSNHENIFLQLNNIQFNKTNFNYTDFESNQLYNFLVHDIIMSGSVANSIDNFTCKGKLFVKKFRTGSINLLKEKNATIDFVFGFDTDKKFVTIKSGEIKIDDFLLKVEGTINNKPVNSIVDILFKAKQLSIQSLLSLLPVKFEEIKDYESSGDIYFNGFAKGAFSSKIQPEIKVDFGIKDGKLNRKSSNFVIDKINCKGHFSNGKKLNFESSGVELKELSMQVKNGTITGNLSVNNFSHPFIDAQLTGKLEASQFINFINNKNIKSADGNVSFSLNFNGNATDFSDKNNWSKTHSSGNFEMDLHHIKVADERKEIETIQASFSLNQNDITINSFQSKVQQSDIDIKGKLINVIPYFLKDNQVLEANIDYTSTYIDVNHFIMPFSSNKKDSANKKEKPLQLPNNIFLKAKLNVNKLVFNNFNATNVNAIINWKGKKISVENFSCQTMNGNLNINGQIENTNDGRFLMTSTSTLKNININELFKQCNNFGQTELTDKYLNGILNATFDIASVWSSKLDCDLDKLYAFGDMQLLNGEIINYKPLEKLSKFADVEDLRHIRFSELKNKIEIKNKIISIPNMDVKSNAINLSLSGTHTFENLVDYKFKIKLSELLKKKRKPQQNEFGEEEDESGKGLYLFLTMKGSIDNPKFSYDKVGVKNKMKQDLKIEKQNIKEILKKELGIGKDTTIKEKKNDNNELEFEKD